MTDGPVYDPLSGEVVDDDGIATGLEGCPGCAVERAARKDAVADLLAAERVMRNQRRRISALETELAERRHQSNEMGPAKALFAYWVERLDKSDTRTKFGEKRQKAVIGRLRDGYPPEYIARAIDGLAVGAYTNESTGMRYDDLELVCRNEVNLERFHRIAVVQAAPTQVTDEWRKQYGSRLPEPTSEIPEVDDDDGEAAAPAPTGPPDRPLQPTLSARPEARADDDIPF